jgi:hypothetical protein
MNPIPWLAGRGGGFLVFSALLLGGCATEIDWPRRQALDSLVGRNQYEIIDALGPPNRSFRDGQASFLAYDYRQTRFVPGQHGQQRPDSEDLWLVTPAIISLHCSTTFKLVDDAVVGWSLAGNDCALAPYPSLGAVEKQALTKAQPIGVSASTDFLADPNTGRSVVEDGAFERR